MVVDLSTLSQPADAALVFDCVSGKRLRLTKPSKAFPAGQRAAAARQHKVRSRILVRDSGFYNCAGLVFAGRRGWFGEEHESFEAALEVVLTEDGFERLTRDNSLLPGDVILYALGDIVMHVGVVVAFAEPLAAAQKPLVLSKFGPWGEYLHDVSDVPAELGTPSSFWRQSFPND